MTSRSRFAAGSRRVHGVAMRTLMMTVWMVYAGIACLPLLPMHAEADAVATRRSELRRACALATQSMEQAEKMQEDLEKVTESEPLAFGYRAMAEFLVGHHSYNPVTKMRCFTAGRDLMEKAVQAAPEMTELRYLRFTIQSRLPGVLPYREHRYTDKEHLMRFLMERRKADDEELAGNIRAALLSSDLCTEDEKARLRK